MIRRFGLAGLALCLPALMGASGSGMGHLRVINLVDGAPQISVEMCAENSGECRSLDIPADGLTETLDLAPAVYRFSVTHADGTTEPFSYGIAPDHEYGLAIYGLSSAKDKSTLFARAKRFLGGLEVRAVNGFRVSHRMVTMAPGKADEPASLRMANFSVGTVALQAGMETGEGTRAIGTAAYAGISGPLRTTDASGAIDVKPDGSDLVVAETPLELPGGSSTMIYASGMTDGEVRLVIDQRVADKASPN
ncbi:hypothetical protein [Oricola sp.]|uniref:hypothetical protein n=1 Tax=Oricola sp. TaxID=1979950 RepID=UPI0025F98ACB|nr:hypothetical protein [Oricola sp.]MCI5075614.1 hypothetical protein [Oricola sp.]